MQHSDLYKTLAEELELWYRSMGPKECTFVDVDNDLTILVEWSETESSWVWASQAVVADLEESATEELPTLLALNDDGLVWCYHAIHYFENDDGTPGQSVNLTYAFATPPGDWQFAATMLKTVMKNMHRCALTITRDVL